MNGGVSTKAPLRWWGTEGLGESVWEAAKKRVHDTFDIYDVVEVGFSGGKDSMATLEVALAVAIERDQLPLKVFFYDDEVIAYETEDYVRRTYRRPEIQMDWLALPVRQRNACTSDGAHEWFPWAPEDRDLWVRDVPPEAITLENTADWYVDKGPEGRPSFIEFTNYRHVTVFPRGKVAALYGIRAGESIMRRGVISTPRPDNFIIPVAPRLDKVYPIYDWTTYDLWTAATEFGWDYNTAYDLMEMRGTHREDQRIGTPFGDEPLERLGEWAECFPDIWERTVHRVPGVAAAARYSRTDLYGYGGVPEKPEGMEWMEFIQSIIDRQKDDDFKIGVAKKLRQIIRHHYSKTSDPILEYPHPVTGASWTLIARIATRGDTKNRKSAFVKRGSPEKYAEALAEHRQRNPATIPGVDPIGALEPHAPTDQ